MSIVSTTLEFIGLITCNKVIKDGKVYNSSIINFDIDNHL